MIIGELMNFGAYAFTSAIIVVSVPILPPGEASISIFSLDTTRRIIRSYMCRAIVHFSQGKTFAVRMDWLSTVHRGKCYSCCTYSYRRCQLSDILYNIFIAECSSGAIRQHYKGFQAPLPRARLSCIWKRCDFHCIVYHYFLCSTLWQKQHALVRRC